MYTAGLGPSSKALGPRGGSLPPFEYPWESEERWPGSVSRAVGGPAYVAEGRLPGNLGERSLPAYRESLGLGGGLREDIGHCSVSR